MRRTSAPSFLAHAALISTNQSGFARTRCLAIQVDALYAGGNGASALLKVSSTQAHNGAGSFLLYSNTHEVTDGVENICHEPRASISFRQTINETAI